MPFHDRIYSQSVIKKGLGYSSLFKIICILNTKIFRNREKNFAYALHVKNVFK